MATEGILLFIFILTIPIVILRKRIAKWLYIRNEVNKIPGPVSYPLVGTVLRFLFYTRIQVFEKFIETGKEYSPIFRTWRGPFPVVHLTDPDLIEEILKSTTNLQKAFEYRFLHPWLGNGLLTSTGSKWHAHRKLLTPAFHFSILDGFMDIFVKKSNILVKLLQKEANGGDFDIYPYITKCTLDIICETAMGTSINAQEKGPHEEYVQAIYEIGELTLKRLLRPWLYPDFIFYLSTTGKKYQKTLKILHDFTKNVIQEKKAKRHLTYHQSHRKVQEKEYENVYFGKKKMALLDVLLETSENENKLTDEEIREEVDTFMFEGHDTTSAAIGWTLYLLGLHKDIQERVHKELLDVLHTQLITTRDLTNMKYLEQVIKESLRLYPSVPFIGRTLEEDVRINGYKLPAGLTVNLFIYTAHRMEKYFPDPETFNPDRFLSSTNFDKSTYSFIPFSAGSRNCIGQKFAMMEEKTILASILRKYKIESLVPRNSMKMTGELVLKPADGIIIKLHER